MNFAFVSAPSTQLCVTSGVDLFRNILCPDRIKIVFKSASFQELVSLCLLTLWENCISSYLTSLYKAGTYMTTTKKQKKKQKTFLQLILSTHEFFSLLFILH